MQRLKTIYPDYQDRVDFYAVGTDPGEKVATLERFRQNNAHPWLVAEAQGRMLRDLNILVQSSKVAFDANGVQTYRDGFGGGGPDDWRGVFEQLAASR